MENSDKQIGRNIKAIRNANKMTIFDFAEKIVLTSVSNLEKIENGTRHATDETIQRIAQRTLVPFNDIKFGDVTNLKKGELALDERVTISDFESGSDIAGFFAETIKNQFPFVSRDNATTNEYFNKAMSLVNSKILNFTGNKSDFIDALNGFINAAEDKNCAGAAAINALSSMGYLYERILINEISLSQKKDISHVKISSSAEYLSECAVSPFVVKNAKEKFFNLCGKQMDFFMKKLAETKENADFAYYFLCLRYLLGLMDEETTHLSNEQMQLFGVSMLDELCKMGNKYAMALKNSFDD